MKVMKEKINQCHLIKFILYSFSCGEIYNIQFFKNINDIKLIMLKRLIICFMGRKINRNKMRRMREAKKKEKRRELENQLREKKTYIRGNL